MMGKRTVFFCDVCHEDLDADRENAEDMTYANVNIFNSRGGSDSRSNPLKDTEIGVGYRIRGSEYVSLNKDASIPSQTIVCGPECLAELFARIVKRVREGMSGTVPASQRRGVRHLDLRDDLQPGANEA